MYMVERERFLIGSSPWIFIGFAIARLFSHAADGKPNKQLVTGLISELVLGAANTYFFIDILV